NAAGVKIKSDPLHAVQLAPGLKVIGNLKGGWQPYASVNMVWNLLDKSDVTANSVKLPEMSIKPYVQYGVGVQKRFKDNCMAFGQAMIQNGGRNGVSLTAGFRRSLGKETKPIEKVQTPQATPKTAQSTSVEKLKLTTQADLVQRANGGVYSSGEKKIVKQLTQNQKTALTKNSPNTTRTTMTGQLKRL
ncbi:MAG: autotransporter outer membrane beta-barrel domain-containing protein, partial [Candidatus Gastranaerophilaceae bacterium]